MKSAYHPVIISVRISDKQRFSERVLFNPLLIAIRADET
ncbi:Uncharacterized protein dnm_007160 [Desulfonema magnum]|uniref:Uncharacterized protein n=1 Tax=Desulfonema magnum TaxID=45655 RepID=A0A975GKK1_9BACT|nr:Uncharacterized protein dnm_007160 [Desulfonema magnum]